MPGRLPDPAPGAGERLRRLQTEPLPSRLRAPSDGDETGAPDQDAAADADPSPDATRRPR